ncbi:hypothetical protein, variant [Allomyces macrogynus ATCC 38327]|uniref:Uncharacterized protein n=1 Tax=Allomyces macrogynus (strain ATCC 38327) TaxID=578462 RepID=A0A0L0SMP3_ALLM3|nr:hypothetical protein, variant [Allomyces macrogynus ATCC 38327]|eukprot:KNE63826.1 hypothetical protein, variant [Allomyces macrogynus ATCC 38327]
MEAVDRVNEMLPDHDVFWNIDELPIVYWPMPGEIAYDDKVAELMLALRAVKLGRQLAQLKHATRNDPFGADRFMKTLVLVNRQFPLHQERSPDSREGKYRQQFLDYMIGPEQERMRRPKPTVARIKQLIKHVPFTNREWREQAGFS